MVIRPMTRGGARVQQASSRSGEELATRGRAQPSTACTSAAAAGLPRMHAGLWLDNRGNGAEEETEGLEQGWARPSSPFDWKLSQRREPQARPCTTTPSAHFLPWAIPVLARICSSPGPSCSPTSQALPSWETFSSSIYQATSCLSVTTSLQPIPPSLLPCRPPPLPQHRLVTAPFQMRGQRRREKE